LVGSVSPFKEFGASIRQLPQRFGERIRAFLRGGRKCGCIGLALLECGFLLGFGDLGGNQRLS
jgi:hypothetical protein